MVVAVMKQTNLDKANRPLSVQSDQANFNENDSKSTLVLSNKMITKLTSEFLCEQTSDPETVTKFMLERNKLRDLPFELVDFINLETINLSYNNFQKFPNVICELVCLREIIMVGCEIEALPTEMDNLIFLEKLVLDLNHIRKIGDVLLSLANLTTLSLGMNYFSVFYSTLPVQIRVLNLDNNHLTCFPDCILTLENLQHLNLSFNRIRELPWEIDCLRKLEQFSIVKNRLQSLPSSISNLDKLKVLDLSNNQLEVLPGNLSNMVSLEEINVINNPMIQPPRHICEHGIDAIKAFQDCLKKQLYEPCNRATKVFILGASRSGKTDLYNFLSGQKSEMSGCSSVKPNKTEPVTKKKFAHYCNNDFESLAVTVFKLSGKIEYNFLSQIFFTRNALYIICVQMDRYKNSNFRSSVLSYIQLVQSVVPDAMILILPTYLAKGARSPITKLQFEKNITDLQNSAKNYIRISNSNLSDELDYLQSLKKEHGFDLWLLHRQRFLENLTKFSPKILSSLTPGPNKKQLAWKVSKNDKCGDLLISYLKELTHVEEFFACNLQDEIQSSWKTLEKLITSYRKKNSGRLYLNRNDILEPAVQIGVNSAEIDDVIKYLNIYGVIFVFDRVAHLRQCMFHDPKTLVDFFNSVLSVSLLTNRNDPSLQQFSPFEIQSTRGELSQHGVITEEMLVQLMRNSVPEADSVDFNYFAALLRNLSIARKVDASNIKEVTKSRNTRSSAVVSKPQAIARNHKYLTKQKSSLFKRDRNKYSRRSLIGRSSSQSDENVDPMKKLKSNHHKRVFSHSALPSDMYYNYSEENNSTSKVKYKTSYFFPWYIEQEYSPQQPVVSDDKSRVMTLWPGYLRSSLYKLQVICVFKNFSDALSILHRLSVALHHCLDYRDDWKGRLSATMESLPLLVEIDTIHRDNTATQMTSSTMPPLNNSSKNGERKGGSEGLPCLSISSKSEIVYSQVMWTIIIQVVEYLLKLFLEYPGLNYELQLVCPHCLKKFPNKQLGDMQRYPWEQIFFNLRDPDSIEDIDDLGLSCPYMNTTERLPTSLLMPPPIEFDPTFSRYFDEILPSLSRTNWRQFAKRLGLSDIETDCIRDSVAASYNFSRQKELMLIFWHRLFLATASTTDLIEACKKQGFTFLVNKLTALQSKLRVPSVLTRPQLSSQSSFSANHVASTSSEISGSMSNVSESCQSIFEELPT